MRSDSAKIRLTVFISTEAPTPTALRKDLVEALLDAISTAWAGGFFDIAHAEELIRAIQSARS